MRRRSIGLSLLAGALVTGSGVYAAQLINGAGATFPYPIYSKWFNEFHKRNPEPADQLPVDRQRRRHQADARRDGRLRRQRRADDRRAAAAGQDPHPAPPDGARRGGADLQPRRRRARCKLHARGARRHLPRQDHASGTTRRSRRRIPGVAFPAGRHRAVHRSDGSGTTVRLHRLPREGEPGVEEEGRARHVGQLAGRARRQGQRGRHRPGQADAERDRLRRARLRARRTSCPTPTSATGRRTLRAAEPRERDRGRRGRRGEHAGRLPRLDHRRAERRRLSHLELHLAARSRPGSPSKTKGAASSSSSSPGC